MASQWDNFRRNLGEWRGSFTSLDREAQELESTASILNLEQGDDERLVHFRLRRFADGNLHGEPSRDNREDYRSLGRQVVFLTTEVFARAPCRWPLARCSAVNSDSSTVIAATGWCSCIGRMGCSISWC
jgi:hypothetical protein